jgi:hypothetical protein
MHIKQLATSPEFELGTTKQGAQLITDIHFIRVCVVTNFAAVLYGYRFEINVLYEEV